MSRYRFFGTSNDYVLTDTSVLGRQVLVLGKQTVTCWDAATGGNQHTDLIVDGKAASVVASTSRSKPLPVTYGPDGVWQMYIDDGTGVRTLATANNLNDVNAQVAANADRAEQAVAQSGATDSNVAARVANGTATRAAIDARWAVSANRPVNLRDNPALDFTGATDSATALQAAINAAGAGTPIELGRGGILRCDTGLVLKLFQRLAGPGQSVGAGATAPTEIRFPNLTGAAVGITGDVNNVLADLILRGPGATVGTCTGFKSGTVSPYASSDPRMYQVGFYGWATGTALANAYYAKLDNCEWLRNKTAMTNVGCYNLHLVTPKIYAAYGPSDSVFGTGINGTARGLTIDAGAIETYGVGGAIVMAANEQLTMNGTYFESSPTGTNAIGVIAAGLNGVAITMTGCLVYLNEHNRFVHMAGVTNSVISAWGNKWVRPSSATAFNGVYYFNAADANGTNLRGRIGPDDWSEVASPDSIAYVTPGVYNMGQPLGLDIRHPRRTYIGADLAGTGAPEGVVYADSGNIYKRKGGGTSTLYVKQSGDGLSTGWVAK